MNTFNLLLSSTAILSILLTAGCDRLGDTPPRRRGRVAAPGTGEVRAVARVGDRVITRDQQAKMVNAYSKSMLRRGEQVPDDIKERVLDLMIEGELLYLAGLDLEIEDLNGKVEEATRRLIEEFPSERAFADNLARRGMTVGMLKDELKRKVVVDEILEREVLGRIRIADEEIEAYYNTSGRFQAPLEESRMEIIEILRSARSTRLLDQLITRLKMKYPVEKIKNTAGGVSGRVEPSPGRIAGE